MEFSIKNVFSAELPADPNRNNTRRQVMESCFSYVSPRIPGQPSLVHASDEMAKALGLSEQDIASPEFLKVFSGASLLDGSDPYAMCYGGHQFGQWAGQLGDGRAINLGEVEHDGKRWTLQLKGSGETPYSRSADGLAVLRSSVREHLCSEAMYHLGVPTTRSLSLCLSGDEVLRDMLYNGNAAYEKGAIVCRVAPGFIRFGSFQIFASRGDKERLKQLSDFTIKHYFPEVKSTGTQSYLDFFNEVLNRTLNMVIEWERVGFVHGVMNTDNMSILGLTIDYGPYGWLEGFDPGWTPNTTDAQAKRYRFGNQAPVALWNLYQLANTLFILVEDAKPFEEALERFKKDYAEQKFAMMRSKLGLALEFEDDPVLIDRLEQVLQLTETDMTIFYRALAGVEKERDAGAALTVIKQAFYIPEELDGEIHEQWTEWLEQYITRLGREDLSDQERASEMNLVNPKYVLRNYMAQLAIDAADSGDYGLIDDLYQLLKQPYAEQIEKEKWFAKRPDWARHRVGCSMLSCSS